MKKMTLLIKYLIVIKYLSFICLSQTECNEVQDHLVRNSCQSETFTAYRSESTNVATDAIKPTSVVRDLGVLLDSELAMRQHVSNLAELC